MNNLLEMYRKTLEFEAKMLNTPDSCTINRAIELVLSAYNLGKTELEEQHLRERYAGMAMQALIPYYEGNPCPRTYPDDCAKSALKYADALIEQLNKEE